MSKSPFIKNVNGNYFVNPSKVESLSCEEVSGKYSLRLHITTSEKGANWYTESKHDSKDDCKSRLNNLLMTYWDPIYKEQQNAIRKDEQKRRDHLNRIDAFDNSA